MRGLIGKKLGMTSVYSAEGKNLPCTLIETGPCYVTQIRTMEGDGYEAVQLGYDDRKDKHTTAALKGHFKKSGVSPKRKLVEFRGWDTNAVAVELGGELNAGAVFAEGEFIDAVGTSKGKGFQGVVRRHNFAGVGGQTHGQHNRGRAPGSIGACSTPSRVFKGMRMAGQMGNKRVTVQNLQVLKVIPEKNLMVVKGSVPGHEGAYVVIQK